MDGRPTLKGLTLTGYSGAKGRDWRRRSRLRARPLCARRASSPANHEKMSASGRARGRTDYSSFCPATARAIWRVRVRRGWSSRGKAMTLPLAPASGSVRVQAARRRCEFVRLTAGGNRIRTIDPALVKGLSAVADERCRTDKLDGVIKHRSSRETTMVGRRASLDGTLLLGGTDGSKPVPSSGESVANRFCRWVQRRAVVASVTQLPLVSESESYRLYYALTDCRA